MSNMMNNISALKMWFLGIAKFFPAFCSATYHLTRTKIFSYPF